MRPYNHIANNRSSKTVPNVLETVEKQDKNEMAPNVVQFFRSLTNQALKLRPRGHGGGDSATVFAKLLFVPFVVLCMQ